MKQDSTTCDWAVLTRQIFCKEWSLRKKKSSQQRVSASFCVRRQNMVTPKVQGILKTVGIIRRTSSEQSKYCPIGRKLITTVFFCGKIQGTSITWTAFTELNSITSWFDNELQKKLIFGNKKTSTLYTIFSKFDLCTTFVFQTWKSQSPTTNLSRLGR